MNEKIYELDYFLDVIEVKIRSRPLDVDEFCKQLRELADLIKQNSIESSGEKTRASFWMVI